MPPRPPKLDPRWPQDPPKWYQDAPKTSQFSRIHVARIERVFIDQRMAEVTLFWASPGSRTGPWQARVWGIMLDEDGSPHREVITADELVCRVVLSHGALTQSSIEELCRLGVPALTQPRRDSTLPPRVGSRS